MFPTTNRDRKSFEKALGKFFTDVCLTKSAADAEIAEQLREEDAESVRDSWNATLALYSEEAYRRFGLRLNWSWHEPCGIWIDACE